jgi:hypothetical protein
MPNVSEPQTGLEFGFGSAKLLNLGLDLRFRFGEARSRFRGGLDGFEYRFLFPTALIMWHRAERRRSRRGCRTQLLLELSIQFDSSGSIAAASVRERNWEPRGVAVATTGGLDFRSSFEASALYDNSWHSRQYYRSPEKSLPDARQFNRYRNSAAVSKPPVCTINSWYFQIKD